MQEEKNQIKINLDPVLYSLSNVNIGFNEEFFEFMLVSGNQARRFRMAPKHAKRIHLLLKKQIDDYERKFGSLKTDLPERKETSGGEKIGFNV